MFTAADKHKCALRELRKRASLYPRWVEAGRMHKATADREMALMEEIARDYAQQEEQERLI